MAMAGLADIQSCNWGRTEMHPQIAIGWQSPPEPTDKQTDGEDPVVAPARALELVLSSGRHEWPPAEQGTCLQISQTRKKQAK